MPVVFITSGAPSPDGDGWSGDAGRSVFAPTPKLLGEEESMMDDEAIVGAHYLASYLLSSSDAV